jgi:hypothetical protein
MRRLVWTAGAAANLAHVLFALHLVHAWDLERAYADIARQTHEQTGFDSGIGLYINFAFSGLWTADAAGWWLLPRRYARRPRWLDGVVQFVCFFMFFNATVVFGKSPIRMFGAVLGAVGTIGWFGAAQRPIEHGTQDPK